MGGLKLGGGGGGGADARSALLSSIQKGTKLRKTNTVDKSGPALAGKVCGSDAGGGGGGGAGPKRTLNNNISTSHNNNSSSSNGLGNGAPKLGGLFEGLSQMPKLKPVNGVRGRLTMALPLEL